MLFDLGELVAIPAVKDQRSPHILFVVIQRIFYDFFPLSHYEANIRICQGFVYILGKVYCTIRIALSEIFDTQRIPRDYTRALIEEYIYILLCGRFAQIVGAGLESESYYRHAHTPEIREESARFINKLYTLFAVDIDSRFYCLELHSGVVALEIERLCILREAAAAVAYSGF